MSERVLPGHHWGLPDHTIDSLRAVFATHQEIDQVLIYGSRAKGTERTGSDIDLAATGPRMSLQMILKIESEIDDLLLPYKVDLCLLAQIENPALLEHIQRVGEVFFERPS